MQAEQAKRRFLEYIEIERGCIVVDLFIRQRVLGACQHHEITRRLLVPPPQFYNASHVSLHAPIRGSSALQIPE